MRQPLGYAITDHMKRPINQAEQRGNLPNGSSHQHVAKQAKLPEVYGRLSRLVPLVALEGDRIAEAFAARHGLHRTDAQALSLLMDANEQGQAVTAGMLGKELRLTSGATTFCIARLQKAGLVTRQRDDADHRKVIISLSSPGRQLSLEFFRPVIALKNDVMDQFSLDELNVVQRFLLATTEAMAQYREAYFDMSEERA